MDSIELTKEYRTQESLDAAVELLQRNGISVKLNGSRLCVSSAKIELASELLAGEGYMFNSICYTPKPATNVRMITSIVYYLYDEGISFHESMITRETGKRYYTEDGVSVEKNTIGIPRFGSASHYPYVLVNMVDADQQTLRAKLREWFDKKADEICPSK